MAGAGGVGKTTLLHRVVHNKFVEDTRMTIGVEFFLLNMNVDNIGCSLQLWDFGGQERFRFMLDSYVMGAKGALLLYDLTRMETLNKLDDWVNICRKHDPELPILFVGTKLDRLEEITVDDDYAQEFLKPLNLFGHIKISSKTGENIMPAFEMLLRQILKRQGVLPQANTQPETQTNTQPETQTNTQPETQTNTQPETQTNTQPETQTNTQSETQTDTQSETQTGTQSETQTDTQSETQTDTQSETQTDTQSETQTDTQSETQTDTQSETQTDKQSETQTGTQSETQTDTQSETKPDTQPETKPDTQPETKDYF